MRRSGRPVRLVARKHDRVRVVPGAKHARPERAQRADGDGHDVDAGRIHHAVIRVGQAGSDGWTRVDAPTRMPPFAALRARSNTRR